jgi:hypothetical protein
MTRDSRTAHLEGVDLEVQVLVFDQAIDPFREHALEVALAGTSARIGRHHSRDGRVGAQQRTEFRRRLELSRQNRLRGRVGATDQCL